MKLGTHIDLRAPFLASDFSCIVDFDLGMALRDNLIPNAVQCFLEQIGLEEKQEQSDKGGYMRRPDFLSGMEFLDEEDEEDEEEEEHHGHSHSHAHGGHGHSHSHAHGGGHSHSHGHSGQARRGGPIPVHSVLSFVALLRCLSFPFFQFCEAYSCSCRCKPSSAHSSEQPAQDFFCNERVIL